MCIAFSPWNYRRSDDDVVEIFANSGGALHLCIHGCDHTRAEFASEDGATLRGKAQLALTRMLEHLRVSGVPFDRVMVFPQGLFSGAAIKALQSSGFTAAANTDLLPAKSTEGFPLFGRRYPRDIAEFAFDLFLGKPALAVEHHGYFRDGQKALENFVTALNRLDERLEWSTLGAACEGASLTRIAADGEFQVRFYTDRFRLMNEASQSRRYLLQRPGITTSREVSINGNAVTDFHLTNGALEIRLVLEAGQTADIVLENVTNTMNARPSPAEPSSLGVGIRRWLCELRDNHIDTNRILSMIVDLGRRLVRPRKLQIAAS